MIRSLWLFEEDALLLSLQKCSAASCAMFGRDVPFLAFLVFLAFVGFLSFF